MEKKYVLDSTIMELIRHQLSCCPPCRHVGYWLRVELVLFVDVLAASSEISHMPLNVNNSRLLGTATDDVRVSPSLASKMAMLMAIT